jgi:hypothetical protein
MHFTVAVTKKWEEEARVLQYLWEKLGETHED